MEEWIVLVFLDMHNHTSSAVRVNNTYSQEFEVKVGVHHRALVLSSFLFICVMEALSREFRLGCPWELLPADDLVIMADDTEEVVGCMYL